MLQAVFVPEASLKMNWNSDDDEILRWAWHSQIGFSLSAEMSTVAASMRCDAMLGSVEVNGSYHAHSHWMGGRWGLASKNRYSQPRRIQQPESTR